MKEFDFIFGLDTIVDSSIDNTIYWLEHNLRCFENIEKHKSFETLNDKNKALYKKFVKVLAKNITNLKELKEKE